MYVDCTHEARCASTFIAASRASASSTNFAASSAVGAAGCAAVDVSSVAGSDTLDSIGSDGSGMTVRQGAGREVVQSASSNATALTRISEGMRMAPPVFSGERRVSPNARQCHRVSLKASVIIETSGDASRRIHMTSRRSMHPDYARRLLSAALVATVLFVIPAEAAGRRRAVTPPTAGNLLTADEISGTVIDDVTNQPVASVKVKVGNRTDTTDAEGKFKVKNVASYHGLIVVEASRSGYTTVHQELHESGNQVLALRAHPGPTVHVRKPSGEQFDIDFD
ncbi:MAG TPA: carboxypeptidase regulatory-like domain-containing protein, partial [Thermoanaerobaculia bacterium]